MISYGFCHLSVVPVRETPSDLSQMTTQLLFGDVFEIFATTTKWVYIKNAYDEYLGWIDYKQFILITEEEFLKLQNPLFINKKMGVVSVNNAHYDILPASTFPSTLSFTIQDYVFEHNVDVIPFEIAEQHDIYNLAFSYLNSPYIWGGKSLFGIDCSGFTQNVYKMAGIKLKRDAAQQATQGVNLSFLNEAKQGDLLFFDNAEGKIIHVGIYLGENKIIHASGKVRIDIIDHQGIYNEEINKYTHNLRLIKSFSS
jgi:hypothetical protein